MRTCLVVDDSSVVRKIARRILDALRYIHERGVVHRDLKPENVMVDDDDNIFASILAGANGYPKRQNSWRAIFAILPPATWPARV